MEQAKSDLIISTLRNSIKSMGFSKKDKLKVNIGLLGLSKYLKDIPDEQIGQLKAFLQEVIEYSETGKTGLVLTPLFAEFKEEKKIDVQGMPVSLSADTIKRYLCDPAVVKILRELNSVL